MKFIIYILSFGFVIQLSAQNVLVNNVENVSIKFENDIQIAEEISIFLGLEENEISLKKVHQVESLTGTHISFDLFKENFKINKAFIKVHINKEDVLFLIQHNYNKQLFDKFLVSSISKNKIYKSLYESYIIDKIEPVFALNEQGVFSKAILVNYFYEANDIYKERLYFTEEIFIEKDLKVHFSPKDTTLIGKAFAPDPLTSAGKEYGEGNYRDEFIIDTTMLIIKTIPNVGQTAVSAGMNSFTLYGQTFNVDDKTVSNNFFGSEIYFTFEDIYIDVEGNLIGYNTFFTDTNGYKTKIVIEDYGFQELDDEQIDIEVLGDFSSSEFRLKNTYFEISDFSLPISEPYSSSVNNFSFSRSNDAFEGINALYHLTTFHDYIENLGFNNLDPQKLIVDVHGSYGADNSFFTNSPSPRLIFGEGGVDDAEDADVIIHEYTHALSYFAAPNTNYGAERKALDEALGDYFCSSYSNALYSFNQFKVFSWDGHNDFWSGRESDSDNTYIDLNLSNSIYQNAEIMSSTLMDIFDEVGKEVADVLVLESLFYNVSENNFLDVANNLLLIDSLVYDGKYKCQIFNVLVNRKFKGGFCVGETVVDENGLLVFNTNDFSLGSGNATILISEDNFEKMDYWISDATGSIILKEEEVIINNILLKPECFNTRGVYFLRIQTNNNKYKTKIVKSN